MHDFVSRYFAPAKGIPEDPVTGGAHCALVPFWAARTGKDTFLAYQASRRGGELVCRLVGERDRRDITADPRRSPSVRPLRGPVIGDPSGLRQQRG